VKKSFFLNMFFKSLKQIHDLFNRINAVQECDVRPAEPFGRATKVHQGTKAGIKKIKLTIK
jgi:hypothetical protein